MDDKWLEWAYKKEIHHDLIGFTCCFFSERDILSRYCFELTYLFENNLSSEEEKEALIDTVGKRLGTELHGFRKISKTRPSLEEIEKYPNDAYMDSRTPFLFATISYLALNLRVSIFDKVLKYTSKMSPEMNILLYYIHFPKTKYYKHLFLN